MERLQTPFERQDGRCHRSAFVRVRPTEGDHRDDIFTCDLTSTLFPLLLPRSTVHMSTALPHERTTYTPSSLVSTRSSERNTATFDSVTSTEPIPASSISLDVHRQLATTVVPVDDCQIQPHQKVYILSADGSALYLINRRTETDQELPPPYAPYRPIHSEDTTFAMGSENPQLLGLVESPQKYHAARRQRAATTTGAMGGRRSRASSDVAVRSDADPFGGGQAAGYHSSRHGSIGRNGQDNGMPGLHRLQSDTGPARKMHVDERTPLLGSNGNSGLVINALGINTSGSHSPNLNGTRAARSISITSTQSNSVHPPVYIETDGNGGLVASCSSSVQTPSKERRVRPSSWRNMLRAPSQMNTPTLRVIDTPDGEAIVVTRPKKKRHPVVRYLRPLWSGAHWAALFHLVFLNFPFVSIPVWGKQIIADRSQAVLLWPLLVAGTLTGTVLLITLPLGALIWFLTLILARSACRLEVGTLHHTKQAAADPLPQAQNATLLPLPLTLLDPAARLLSHLSSNQARTWRGRTGAARRGNAWRGPGSRINGGGARAEFLQELLEHGMSAVARGLGLANPCVEQFSGKFTASISVSPVLTFSQITSPISASTISYLRKHSSRCSRRSSLSSWCPFPRPLSCLYQACSNSSGGSADGRRASL